MSKNKTIYDFKLKAIDGKIIDFKNYENKVLLIVNVASKCGFTPQYEGLEKLHRTYSNKGLVVLGFPCDQFGHQEPGTENEIAQFCSKNYGVSFQMFSKINVNGKDEEELYKWLKSKGLFTFSKAIKWNFTKFLVSKDGTKVKRFSSLVKPENLSPYIEKLLA